MVSKSIGNSVKMFFTSYALRQDILNDVQTRAKQLSIGHWKITFR